MSKQNLLEELQKYHINARAYKRPLMKDLFLINVLRDEHPGTILVNQGTARVQVNGDHKVRQAVVTVRERSRVVTKRVKGYYQGRSRPEDQMVRNRLIQKFPVNMPANTKWDISNVCIKQQIIKSVFGKEEKTDTWHISGRVKATVTNNTVNHFLMGWDETDQFIAPLTQHVNSVAEAHRLLRPKYIRRNSPRQGEWFFSPCGKIQSQRLDGIVAEDQHRMKSMRLGKTTHYAKSAINVAGVIYARGYICDDRVGHHVDKFLPTWHKIVKNKETEMKVSAEQKEAALRRRRSFD